MPNNLNAHSIQAKCNLEMVTSFSICLDCSTSLLPFFKTAHVSSCLEILILNFCEFIFTKEIETCLKPRPWRTSQALAARPPILQWFIKYMEAYHSWERQNILENGITNTNKSKQVWQEIVLHLHVTIIWSWMPGFSGPNFCWNALAGISKASGIWGRGMQTLKGILPWENSSVERTSRTNTSPSPSTRASSSSKVTAAMTTWLWQVPKSRLSEQVSRFVFKYNSCHKYLI